MVGPHCNEEVSRWDRSNDSRARGTYVLIVDNHAQHAEALAQQLRAHSVTADIALGIAEALARVASQPPDVIIMDAPGPTLGVALLGMLQDIAPDVPTIVTSGFTREHGSFAVAVRSMGAHYVSRPIQIEQLMGSLADLVEVA
jgi:DNA-binding NtrC family response regulator